MSLTALTSFCLFISGGAAQTQTCLPGQTPNYTLTQMTGSITPGTVDTGNHCDDCTTAVTLPFPVTIYDQTFTTARVSSNGNLQFVGSRSNFGNTVLPNANFNTTIFPLWDDLQTNSTGGGIFTSVSGAQPNRTFHIEWRARHVDTRGTTNFEIQLIEGSATFHVIYGDSGGAFSGTVGVQRDCHAGDAGGLTRHRYWPPKHTDNSYPLGIPKGAAN